MRAALIRIEAGSAPAAVTVEVPGDKSVTHRAVLLGLLAQGTTHIRRPLRAEDTRRSLAVARAFGARVEESAAEWVIESQGLGALREPGAVIDCGNSGTTMRLAIGMAALVPGLTVLTGDASLCRRPMRRVTDPLGQLGIDAWTRADGGAPVAVRGGSVHGGRVVLPVASAQVKSALLLAALGADGPVTVEEPMATRDHTERMLAAQGITVDRGPRGTTIFPGTPSPLTWTVPGDPSSAAFWWAWAALTGSRVVTEDVLLNPARTGFLRVLRRMGAQVEESVRTNDVEPLGRVAVTGPDRLSGTTVVAAEVPGLVDELPLVAVLMCRAAGRSEVSGAGELRVKESDRIKAMGDGLRAMGADISDRVDGWVVERGGELSGARVDAAGDHRVAMALSVAAAAARGPVLLTGADTVAISYPGFFDAFEAAGAVRVSSVL
jgi:3-phosphoshikimate 1-carboxyvinyltransferase